MRYVAPLMAEAWEQHRRRRNRLLLAALLSIALAAVSWWLAGGLGAAAGGGQGPGGVAYVRAAAVLARSPYMGVAVCHPSSSACYRLGLAVWLRKPARSVSATVSGVGLSPPRSDRRRGVQMIAGVRGREFVGFVDPSGIVPRAYLATPDVSPNPPFADVKLRIEEVDGRTAITRVRVPVQPGWG